MPPCAASPRLAAIERAQRSILLETYIFADDRVGNRFSAALAGAARRGVQDRLRDGPLYRGVVQAFAGTWAKAGRPMEAAELPRREDIPMCGDVALRIIATEPSTTGVLRLDQFIAAHRTADALTDRCVLHRDAVLRAGAAVSGHGRRRRPPPRSRLERPRAGETAGTAGYRRLLESDIRVFERSQRGARNVRSKSPGLAVVTCR